MTKPTSLEVYLAQRTDIPNRDSILFSHRQDLAQVLDRLESAERALRDIVKKTETAPFHRRFTRTVGEVDQIARTALSQPHSAEPTSLIDPIFTEPHSAEGEPRE